MSDDNYYSIDLKDALVRNTQNWFPEPIFSASVLAAHVLMATFTFGAKRALVGTGDRWWGVFADIDWFATSSVSLNELRSPIVPFSGQVNAMRPETWLVAYADDVRTTSDNDESVPDVLRQELRSWERGLVFRVAVVDPQAPPRLT